VSLTPLVPELNCDALGVQYGRQTLADPLPVRQLMEGEPKYRVSLYLRGTPDEFEWNMTEVYGFLAPRLRSKTDAADAISEADEKGSTSRTIEYALGHTARVVILRVTP
jgi:hypothetical protein